MGLIRLSDKQGAMLTMENSVLFRTALKLRNKGKYKEALDIFVGIADKEENPLERAGMLLNIVNTLPNSGQLERAKAQLESVRSLLSSSLARDSHHPYSRYHRYLTIAADLEDARISEAEGKFNDAIDTIDRLRTEFNTDLQKVQFQELHWAIERERGFALVHIGSTEAALQILEQVDRADPHDRFTLYYLASCYSYAERYAEARVKIEESISLGLPPDWAGRAHFRLGAACYQLQDYKQAKVELEAAVKTAPPEFIRHEEIWRWLQYTCISLGLKDEAEHYAKLARPA
jgi:tetratricopeptide (TPR) repeat protein